MSDSHDIYVQCFAASHFVLNLFSVRNSFDSSFVCLLLLLLYCIVFSFIYLAFWYSLDMFEVAVILDDFFMLLVYVLVLSEKSMSCQGMRDSRWMILNVWLTPTALSIPQKVRNDINHLGLL